MSIVKKKTSIFFCRAGVDQAAITPQGELKLCLMIDSPRYKILPGGIKAAWKKLSMFSGRIKAGKDYHCTKCPLIVYCKWCPARSWLHNRSFTSCVPELKIQALRLKESLAQKTRKDGGKRKR